PIAPAHPVVPASAPGALHWLRSAGDDAERSDAEERRVKPAGDDAVGAPPAAQRRGGRSDAEERGISPGPISSTG
ncbi:MAG: hypothetical protein WA415_04550, partial [Mycobacterium sp.]